MRYHKKWGKPCGVLTVFCELVFTARTFQNINFKLFLRIHLHSQNLPEAYSWMRGKKQTQNQNLPEAHTWMRYNKKEGKPCGVFPFFLTSFSQPGPAGTIHLNQTKKNTGTHNTWMNEIQKRKTMWRFNFFCETKIGFHSQNVPEHTPQWNRIGKNMKSMWRFQFFWLYLRSQNLPEAYSCMRGKKQAHS